MVLSPLSADCVSRESAPLFLSSPQKLLFSCPPFPSPPPASDNLSRRKRRGLMECGGGGKSNPHMGFLSLASHGSFFKTLNPRKITQMIGEKGGFCAFSMPGYSGRRVWPPSASAVAGKGGRVKVVVIHPTVFLGFGGPPPENRPPPPRFFVGCPTADRSPLLFQRWRERSGIITAIALLGSIGGRGGILAAPRVTLVQRREKSHKKTPQAPYFYRKGTSKRWSSFPPLCMPRCLRGTLL